MTQHRTRRRHLLYGCLAGVGLLLAIIIILEPYVAESIRNRLSDLLVVRTWFGGGGLQVYSISFSPDGSRLAVGHNFPPLTCIWDVNSGSQILVIEENKHEAVERVTFSPNGALLAVGINKLSDVGSAGECVRVRDAETGSLISEIDGSYSPIFTPDGNLLIGDEIYRVPDGTLVKRLNAAAPKQFRTTGLWSTKGGSLFGAIGSRDPGIIALIWDAKTGNLLKTVKCPEAKSCVGGSSFDFSEDGKHLVIGTTDDAFYIWEMDTENLKIIRREGGRWWAVRYSPDGQLVAASGAGGTVLIWDVNDNKEIGALKRHVGSVYALEFSPNGDLVATGGMDGTVRLWGMTGRFIGGWGLVRDLRLNHKSKR
jgi:WD40 repeat protein